MTNINEIEFIKFLKLIEDKKINLQQTSFYLFSFENLSDLQCLNIFFKRKNILAKFCKKNKIVLFFVFINDEWEFVGEYSFAGDLGTYLVDNNYISNIEVSKIEKILREFILLKI